MRLFLDSARLDKLQAAIATGRCDGVTTNPSLLKKAAELERAKGGTLDLAGYLGELLRIAGPARPVSLEVAGLAYDEMVREGQKLYERFNPIAGNVVVKVPICTATPETPELYADGLRAIRTLTAEGIPVNVTLVMTPVQAMLAGLAGTPAYVSPFAGRLDDLLRERAGLAFGKEEHYPQDGLVHGDALLEDDGIASGIDLVATIVRAYKRRGIPTQVLAASLRNPAQVAEASAVGAHCATVPLDVLRDVRPGAYVTLRDHEALFERFAQLPAEVFSLDNLAALLHHEKTVDGIRKFKADADAVPEYAALLR
jgi:transaldolase